MARGEFRDPPAQKPELRSQQTNKAKREARKARLDAKQKS